MVRTNITNKAKIGKSWQETVKSSSVKQDETEEEGCFLDEGAAGLLI